MLSAYHNTRIINNGEIISGKAVLVQNGRIIDVVDSDAIPTGARLIDLNNHYLAPGLIDLQIYGTGKHFFGGLPSVEALQGMESDLLRQGCTGFLATVATNNDNVVEAALAAARSYRSKTKGAFLGLHLEGPFINPKRRGAHSEKYIKKATLARVKRLIELANREVKMITLAPELQDAAVLDYLAGQGIILSCGHSDADYKQAKNFLGDAVTAATHLYNAMPSMHHREAGLIPAIFEAQPFTSIVADGVHVSFQMIALAKRNLGDKLFLITDAVTASNEGTYQHMFASDRYTMPDGTLSGSCLTMLKAVQNCVEHCNISLAEAVNMASLYPAQLIGLDSKGRIGPGCDADMVIFDDNFDLQQVVLKGEPAPIAT